MRLIWVIRVRIIRIIGIVGIRGIGIGESEPDEDRIRPEKTVIGEKAIIREKTAIYKEAIIREKAAVSNKRATAKSIILPKSEATGSPKFMRKTSTRPHPCVTAGPSPHVTAKSRRGDRKNSQDCGHQKNTKFFH
jgi:hypothetical protein